MTLIALMSSFGLLTLKIFESFTVNGTHMRHLVFGLGEKNVSLEIFVCSKNLKK
jgi:hypothetical protein